MNDHAREVLIAAALNGVTQCKWVLRGWGDARCAMGVLNEAAWGDVHYPQEHPYEKMKAVYDISPDELVEIVKRNNVDGWDFLTIARKCCLEPPHGPEEVKEG